jgi:hypothetical protein
MARGVESELSKSTRDQYEMYMATHLAPFFKTVDRVTSESAMDYRRLRLKGVQRISLLKELCACAVSWRGARARNTSPRCL